MTSMSHWNQRLTFCFNSLNKDSIWPELLQDIEILQETLNLSLIFISTLLNNNPDKYSKWKK